MFAPLRLRGRAWRRRALRLRAPLSPLRLRLWPVVLPCLLTIRALFLRRVKTLGPLFRSVLRAIAAFLEEIPR